MPWRRLFADRRTVPDRPTIEVRLSCGLEFTLHADTAEPLFDVEEKLTDPRPGFTELPAEMVDTGHRVQINRAHVVMVKIR